MPQQTSPGTMRSRTSGSPLELSLWLRTRLRRRQHVGGARQAARRAPRHTHQERKRGRAELRLHGCIGPAVLAGPEARVDILAAPTGRTSVSGIQLQETCRTRSGACSEKQHMVALHSGVEHTSRTIACTCAEGMRATAPASSAGGQSGSRAATTSRQGASTLSSAASCKPGRALTHRWATSASTAHAAAKCLPGQCITAALLVHCMVCAGAPGT